MTEKRGFLDLTRSSRTVHFKEPVHTIVAVIRLRHRIITWSMTSHAASKHKVSLNLNIICIHIKQCYN